MSAPSESSSTASSTTGSSGADMSDGRGGEGAGFLREASRPGGLALAGLLGAVILGALLAKGITAPAVLLRGALIVAAVTWLTRTLLAVALPPAPQHTVDVPPPRGAAPGPAAGSAMPDEVISEQFEVLGRIGGGGQADVYRCRDRMRLTRAGEVAVKILRVPETYLNSREIWQEWLPRCAREGRILNELRNPHIVRFIQAGIYRDRPYFVTELVQGQTLDQLIRDRLAEEPQARDHQAGVRRAGVQRAGVQRAQRPGFPADEVLRIAREVCTALEAAHSKGVIHLDIKPSNIMIGRDTRRTTKVVDFGIAALSDITITFTEDPLGPREVKVVGFSEFYGSPEQFTGHDVDERSDLFSLGCVLYELLTLHRPYPRRVALGDVLGPVASARLTGQAGQAGQAGPGEERPALRAGLAELVEALLVTDRDRRPDNVGDVLEWLGRIEAAGVRS